MTTTSSMRVTRRREIPPVAALLLTIGGNMLALAIVAVGLAGAAIAAFAVFGPQLLAAL
ncbi:MAG: hypothetical protein M3Y46_02990 [Actinomycetota bacterium]|nr:hypothetical protein [Actinomycetota bacterium]